MFKLLKALVLLACIPCTLVHSHTSAPVPKADRAKYTKMCEDYLNSIGTLSANITQMNSIDRSFYKGTLYIERSKTHYGKSSLSIKYRNTKGQVFQHLLAHHEKVFIIQPFAKDPQDRKQEYPLYQTPADILLQPVIKFGQDIQIQSLKTNGQQIFITLVKEGEEEHFSLSFSFDLKPTFRLLGWTVVDPQGNRTHVALENIKLNGKLPADAFKE